VGLSAQQGKTVRSLNKVSGLYQRPCYFSFTVCAQ